MFSFRVSGFTFILNKTSVIYNLWDSNVLNDFLSFILENISDLEADRRFYLLKIRLWIFGKELHEH